MTTSTGHIAQLSRDPFSRTTTVRYTERSSYATCRWCGQRGNNGRLYVYGTQTDSGRTSWDDHRFCSKSCYNSYHS